MLTGTRLNNEILYFFSCYSYVLVVQFVKKEKSVIQLFFI